MSKWDELLLTNRSQYHSNLTGTYIQGQKLNTQVFSDLIYASLCNELHLHNQVMRFWA